MCTFICLFQVIGQYFNADDSSDGGEGEGEVSRRGRGNRGGAARGGRGRGRGRKALAPKTPTKEGKGGKFGAGKRVGRSPGRKTNQVDNVKDISNLFDTIHEIFLNLIPFLS